MAKHAKHAKPAGKKRSDGMYRGKGTKIYNHRVNGLPPGEWNPPSPPKSKQYTGKDSPRGR